jgi:DNA-binding XRE family transcriptional regulator
MSWPKKSPLGSPRNDFRDSGQGAVPLKWLPYGGWAEAEYQSGARPDCQKQPEWITFSALEWITFRALQTLGMLRWLGRPPECFVPHETDLPKAPLPKAGPDRRLRWDIWAMAELLDAERRSRGLTWNQLAQELACSSNQISGLRRRRYGISIQLAMRIARWLRRPAADFIVAAEW